MFETLNIITLEVNVGGWEQEEAGHCPLIG